MWENRDISYISRDSPLHTNFSESMVSWAVLLQSPPSAAELPSRCDPVTAGTLKVVVELLLRLVVSEAGKLWFGAGWWDNTTW